MFHLATDSRIQPEARALLERCFTIHGPLLEDNAERRASLVAADALVISSMWTIGAAELASAPKLRAIGRPGVGLDNVDLPAATRHGVCVVNTPDAPSQSTAEHAVALLVALAKGLRRSDANFRARGWETRAEFLGSELHGKTLCLVGVGRIGSSVARTMREGFAMRVLAYDPYMPPERAAALGVELKGELRAALAEADFVSIHCALTPQTRGLLGKAELAALRPHAFLVNCARGPIIDQDALVAALRAGALAGAGIDVYEPEPAPPDHPLLGLERVIVTPHIASHTLECERGMHRHAAEEVLRVFAGTRPRWLVNPDVWERRRTG